MISIDIDMPKSCNECIFNDRYIGCVILEAFPPWNKEQTDNKKRREDCPLIETHTGT